jgi:hypothetical protein
MAAAGTAVAGDVCKNVKFEVTNKHDSGEAILIKKVKYFNKANGKWQTEVVNQNVTLEPEPLNFVFPFEKEPGLLCNQGATCTTNGNNLRDAEGEDLTKFRFVYKYAAAGKWSGEVEGGDKIPENLTCHANKTYGAGRNNWKISGKD